MFGEMKRLFDGLYKDSLNPEDGTHIKRENLRRMPTEDFMDLGKSGVKSHSTLGKPLFPLSPSVKPQKSESIQFYSRPRKVDSEKSIAVLDRWSRRHSTTDDTPKASDGQASNFVRRRFTEMSPPGSQSAINFKSESVPLGSPLKIIREENGLAEEIAPEKFGRYKSTMSQGQNLVGSPGDWDVSIYTKGGLSQTRLPGVTSVSDQIENIYDSSQSNFHKNDAEAQGVYSPAGL
jgi:hypothetical protein